MIIRNEEERDFRAVEELTKKLFGTCKFQAATSTT